MSLAQQVKDWVKQWYYQARAFPPLIAQLIAKKLQKWL